MNDPHVQALIYRCEHPVHIDFSNAKPTEGERPGFKYRLDRDELRIDLIDHCQTEDAARAVVEPFLSQWELAAELQYPPVRLRFVFHDSEVIDRNPTPGVVAARASVVGVATVSAVAVAGHSSYPAPPVNITRDSFVDLMFTRYQRYRDGGTPLADAANYCLTTIEAIGEGERMDAAARLKISGKILGKLAELAANKGGEGARKYKGSHSDFTASEQRWLKAVLPKLIQRAAEYAFDPDLPHAPEITMADLPNLKA